MKHLKTFEKFFYDFGNRFSDNDSEEQDLVNHTNHEEEMPEEMPEEECEYCKPEESECKHCGKMSHEEEEEEESEMGESPKNWGDEVVERKKAKPDFLDLDKDGNKKESMKKAAKDAKEKDKKKDDTKGLSASQKKLPAGLQKAILAKKKK